MVVPSFDVANWSVVLVIAVSFVGYVILRVRVIT